MIAEWAHKYVGLPYKEGCWGPTYYDCWGLFSLVYRLEFNIDVIGSMMPYDNNHEKIGRLQEKISEWNLKSEPDIGDAILFLLGGRYPHCGIYVGDNKMLHSIRDISSCIEPINSLRWKSRLEGYYGYVQSSS